MRISRRITLHILLYAFLPLCLCSMTFTARAQKQSHPTPQELPPPQAAPAPPQPDPFQNMLTEHSSSNNALHNSNPHVQQMLDRMAIKRSAQRREKIASQSAQLLALANKLQTDVSKSNKNELSVSVVKEAAEIEELAKSIKLKVKDGY